jgi:predicted dehydrogenase
MRKRTALLVGAGGMGRVWAKTLTANPDVELRGWVDLQRAAVEAGAAELGLEQIHIDTELERALATVRPDFLVDVTIPEAHHDVTLTALAAGVPVLGEKPMAATMEHARAMVAAAEKAGLLYMVSQSRRYNPGIHGLRRLIAEQLGSLGLLTSDFFRNANFGAENFRSKMPSPLVLDMAIHTFDAARYLSGADPIAVYCEEYNPPWSWYAGDACATAIFEMTGGLRYTYRGSWCTVGRDTSWEGEWRACSGRGTAVWDGTNEPMVEVEREGIFEEHSAPLAPDFPIGIVGSLREFLHALETGTTPMGECHDNIKSLAMVFAAIESASLMRRVVIGTF